VLVLMCLCLCACARGFVPVRGLVRTHYPRSVCARAYASVCVCERVRSVQPRPSSARRGLPWWISASATVRFTVGRGGANTQAGGQSRRRGKANDRGTVAERQLSTVDSRTALAPLDPVVVALSVGSLARWFDSPGGVSGLDSSQSWSGWSPDITGDWPDWTARLQWTFAALSARERSDSRRGG
jgi:hypothetical protein